MGYSPWNHRVGHSRVTEHTHLLTSYRKFPSPVSILSSLKAVVS